MLGLISILAVLFNAHADYDFFPKETPDLVNGINGQILHKALEEPRNFPAALYRANWNSDTKVIRYLIDGQMPTGRMQNSYFKIYLKESDDVIKWEARNTAASNVYYHLFKAIDYFETLSRLTGEKIYRENKPTNIRIEMHKEWAMWIKFSTIDEFNTSRTLPDADPDKVGTPEEQREIWFFSPERRMMPAYVPGRYIPGIKNTVLGTQGFPLDSARVPTVIYHEWAHLMTRPYLGIGRNTVLNESYSDYFGSVISGTPEIGETEEFSSFPYHREFWHELEPATVQDYTAIGGTFVPTLFWQLRKKYGPGLADIVIWRSLRSLTQWSTLANLPYALEVGAQGILSEAQIKELRERLRFLIPGIEHARKGH